MRRAFFVALATCAAACGLGALACSSSSSSSPVVETAPEAGVAETGLVEAGAPDALPFPLAQVCKPVDDADQCRKCAKERCCDTRDAIFATDAGNDLVSCNGVAGCGETCTDACFKRYPDQVRPYLDHLACLVHHCQPDCAAPVDPCAACMEEKCTLENLACNLSPACVLATSCGAACPRGDETCLKACGARYPETAQLTADRVICGTNRCPDECTRGGP